MNARSMLHRSLYEFQLYLLKILVLFFMSKFGTMGFQLTFLHLGTLQPAAVAAAILDLSDDEEPEIVVIPICKYEIYAFSFSDNQKDNNNEKQKRKKRISPRWINDSDTFTEPIPARHTTSHLSDDHPELSDLSMVEVFKLMFPPEIVDVATTETLRYARQKNDHVFITTTDEIWKFIGILILSGYNLRRCQRHYWEKSDDVCCPAVQNAMSREHFKRIKSYFHLVNNDDIVSHPTSQKSCNKMFKLQPAIDLLNKAWIQFGTFEPNVCIDEQMIPYYGNVSIKQFLKGKPVRYGFKIWMLCSADGFCYQFDVYCGKKDRECDDIDLPLGSKVVIDLLKCVPDEKAVTVFFDNFFTS